MSETQIEAESAQGAKKPSPETLLDAAVLSSAMYNLLSPKKPELNGYKIHHFEFGDKSNFRITNWCIFAKEKMTIERKKSIRLFIVVRGSQSAIDWLVNFSFIPAAHPTYKFVEVHSGYAAEVAREYGLIKQWLISFFENHNADDVVDVVISGHSKGGGLAQLIIDKFYNDDVFKSTYRQIFMKMTCVTFAAPFVYWFPDLTMVENVKSGHLLHNYVIRGDPVPVLQLLLKDSDAFLSLVKKEISFIGIPAIEFLGVKDKVEEIAPLLEGFAPIGKIYSATLSSSSSAKSFGKTFVRSEYKYDSLDDWDCVNHNSFGSAYHDISNHIMVADSKSDQDGVLKFGLYVRNATQSDVWIIMTGFHLFYCQCVPPGKVHIGSTWSKYLTVSISALNHEPGFTDGLRQRIVDVGKYLHAPFVLLLVIFCSFSLAEYYTTSHVGDHNWHGLALLVITTLVFAYVFVQRKSSNIYCDGMTVLVKQLNNTVYIVPRFSFDGSKRRSGRIAGVIGGK